MLSILIVCVWFWLVNAADICLYASPAPIEHQTDVMNAQTQDTLQEIFRAVFELPRGAEVTGVRQLNTTSWDSVAHVALVTAIESEFGLSLDAGDQLRMTGYATTAILLEERGL